MQIKFFRILRILISCFILISVGFGSGCAGVSSLTSGGNLDSNTQTLSDAEAQLYESGPIQLPVTIAKLDGANADLITVTFSESGISSQLNTSSDTRTLSSETGSGYTITGAAGAINTDQATKIFGLHTENGDSIISDVAADGSFEFSILAEQGDVIAFAPMVEDESQIGIPLFADYDNGVVTIVLTNSSVINNNQNIVIDIYNNTYFSSVNTDGTYGIYRKSLDGTEIQTIATGITDLIRFIAVDGASNITYITQSGLVFYIQTELTNPSLLQDGASPLYTTWYAPIQIHDFEDSLSDAQTFIPATSKTFNSDDGRVFLATRKTGNQPVLFTYIDPISNTQFPLVMADDYVDFLFDLGGSNVGYAFVKSTATGANYELYLIDLTDREQAWENRVLIYTHTADKNIVSLDVSVHNVIAFASSTITEGEYDFFVMPSVDAQPELIGSSQTGNGKIYSEVLVVNPRSTSTRYRVVLCATDPVINRSYLVNYRSEHDANTFYRLTNAETKNGCSGTYAMDSEKRLVFYRTQYDENGNELEPQLSFIDFETLDLDTLVIDE